MSTDSDSTHFDSIVIGAGQAGPSLAVRFAGAGMKTALIEREHLGGTCVNNGCIPTKTLVASARVAHMARRARDFGVVLDAPVRVDMAAVKARKDAIVQESIDSLTGWIGSTPNLQLFREHARFTGPKEVRVGDRTLRAERIIINTGGRPTVPDWPGLAHVPYLTNTSMMAVDFLPEHLIIVGGSYIGLEFAQMYRRFGAAVTVVEYGPRVIGREDEEVSAAIQAVLAREGVRFHLAARDLDVAGVGSGIVLRGRTGDTPLEVRGSHLLIAVGRRPNSDDLGLAQAGIKTDPRGYITVDDSLQTNVAGVWAVGDVNGRGAFTHTSYNDYEIVAANLLDGDARRLSDRITAYALFTDPPLGRVGATAGELLASGRRALVGTMPMTRVGRARERGETDGFMKVLVDEHTRQILGAALLCIEGDEAVHCLLDAMYARAPYTVIQRAVHVHPTVSELIPTLLASLQPLRPS